MRLGATSLLLSIACTNGRPDAQRQRENRGDGKAGRPKQQSETQSEIAKEVHDGLWT